MRSFLSALSVGLLAIAVLLIGSPASASTNYVALGDSYASGTGAGDYSGGDCQRSSHAYPVLWAQNHAGTTFTFAACSGAVTADVINGQVNSLSAATSLVTISIGGNDAGFADVMYTCTVGSDSDCVNKVNQAKTFVQNTLPGRLDNTYAAIRAHAPNARVIVMGYPHLFSSSWCWWFSTTKRNAVNSGSDLLSSVTAGRASAAGFTYEDSRDNFAGHEVCTGSAWINGLTFDGPYHPNATGQNSGYYAALRGVTG